MDNRENMIPLNKAVLYAAVIVALTITGSFIYQRQYVEKNMPALVKQAIENLSPSPEKAAPITSEDHLLGDSEAPVKLLVYTDFECPFCKTFHQSLASLKDTYIKEGKLAVVYRNMPLDQLHAKARPEAIAAECAAKLGGNEKYWSYVDKIFSTTPSNDGLDLNLLPKFAVELGLNEKNFNTCLNDEKIAAKVEAEVMNAQEAGGQGTPYPIVLVNGEVKGALAGAIPVEDIKELVDQLLVPTDQN